MFKKYIILLISTFLTVGLHAQDAKSVYDHYLDFNLARLQGETKAALDIGVILLDDVDSLPAKSRISFYNSMGKLCEDNGQPERATPYYEKVIAAVPNYYVAHRALGYIYLAPANDLFSELQGSKRTDANYAHVKEAYKAAATKALQHLEIAQACDPGDDTLLIIKTLYKNMGDTTSIGTLNERLAKLTKNCLDILSDN
jgi:tetratricopeptide (TPR) repeat protein